MQHNLTSAADAVQDKPFRFVTFDQNECFCPNCGRSCPVALLDGEATGRSLCSTLMSGCGHRFSWSIPDGELLTCSKLSATVSEPPKQTRPKPRAETSQALRREIRASQGRERAKAASGERAASEKPGQPEAAPSVLDNGAKSVSCVSDSGETSYGEIIADPKVAESAANFDRRHQIGNRVAGRMIQRGLVEDGLKVLNCSTEVVLRRYRDCERVQVCQSNWCQKRILCPNCEKARSARTIGKWVPKIVQAITDNDSVPYMVTLTARNGPDLVERVGHIFDGLKRANQKRRDHLAGNVKADNVWSRIQGAIWHLEIKRGKRSGEWHPHLHGLCLLPRGVKLGREELSVAWRQNTGDSFIVDAQRTNFGRAMFLTQLSAEDCYKIHHDWLLKDLCEILKYCLKFEDAKNPDDIIDAHYSLKRKHLARAWGCLRGLKVVDELKNGEVVGEGAYLDYILRWCAENNRYGLHDVKAGFTEPE